MRTRLTLLFVACAIIAGCRSNPEHQLLERELRLQEDKIYHLQAMLEDCHAMLESSRRENESLKREVTSGDHAAGAEPLPSGGTGPFRSVLPPPSRSTRPSASEPSGPAFAPPTIELPENPDNSIPVPPAPDTSTGTQTDAPASPVAQIVLDARLTGGRNVDGRPGDEGVLVAFQPQDTHGKLVQTPGDVSVVILDPAKQGAEARVARWDFSSDEVSRRFRKSLLGRNLQFDLPWPSDPPTNSRLHLFVRYVTADGQKLVAERIIDVDPPVRRASGWTRVTNTGTRTDSTDLPTTTIAESRPASKLVRHTEATSVEHAAAKEPAKVDSGPPETSRVTSQSLLTRNIKSAVKPTESPRPSWSPYR